ncbi:MAG: hypothetical protein P8P83_04370 [Rickettsiaceae bacterium]|nr:hypothetical protein [Rickettsiaceae bacterium]
MFKISNLLGKFKQEETPSSPPQAENASPTKTPTKGRTWSEEHYDAIIVQRNLMFVLTLILLCL